MAGDCKGSGNKQIVDVNHYVFNYFLNSCDNKHFVFFNEAKNKWNKTKFYY